ncbi:fungal-specific transcription factor domain-containing protein [Stachybotrys elegans]|uniref:Fungal-specific transcription factor domain-containing protein n=1 Tax=Stachybotrys elegans TaxID=80388 RepID=A0A8K0SJ53_9HYPO|nr:fungal-specific transcription factor domain-containing protein [Stachybotrys elegans]
MSSRGGPDARSVAPPVARPRHTRSNVCTQCRRQKQKCDRNSPCGNCVRRDIPHLCHLPPRSPRWMVGTPSTVRSAAATAPSACLQPLPPPPPPPPPPILPASASSASSGVHGTPASTVAAVPSITSPATTAGGRGRSVPSTGPRHSSADHLPPRIGHLWNSRGAPSYHGSSYFGHQSAADMMQVESPELPVGFSGIHASNARRGPQYQAHRSEKGPYSHIWELIGYLPRRKTIVDHLVRRFIDELNPVYDSLHEETFMHNYEAFWNRRWGDDDLTSVDLRWLSLLFVVLAFAELLDCPPDALPETQREHEETSVQFFWASRKAIVISPTFSGESPDLVRAGILVSRYLLYTGRKTEAWLTSSFAIRMAQAQGMHVDGESWGLPPKVLETRRRLWSALYALDRSISLAIGRPYTINDRHCMKMNIRNIWVDSEPGEAYHVRERPLSDPTPSIYYLYQQRLAAILGDIHDECFGISPASSTTWTSYATYEKVLDLDRVLLGWLDSLPPYFRLKDPDMSLDNERPYLYWQRMYLHTAYHFARVTLHRSYVLLESATDRFQYSRDACASSACADLKLKLSLRVGAAPADRLKAGVAMHNLFNSALVLGIVAVRAPSGPLTAGILDDLAAYCEKQRADSWVNEFQLAEVKVIELCIASARKSRREAPRSSAAGDGYGNERGSVSVPSRGGTGISSGHNEELSLSDMPAQGDEMRPQHQQHQNLAWPMADGGDGLPGSTDLGGGMDSNQNWLAWNNLPEPLHYQLWEDLVGSLEARQ